MRPAAITDTCGPAGHVLREVRGRTAAGIHRPDTRPQHADCHEL